jgi:RNA polymerase sigma factor (sigma-70 family)
MLHRILPLSEDLDKLLYSYEYDDTGDNSQDRKIMFAIMRKAIREELTNKQRHCIYEHYYNGKSMKKIAEELGVAPSTITRHIQSAKQRLRKIAKYYH